MSLKRFRNKIAKIEHEERSLEQTLIRGSDTWMVGSSLAGVYVSTHTAMSVPIVRACVQAIATAVSSMPCLTYERLETHGKQVNTNHAVYDLLYYEANPSTAADVFINTIIGHAALTGNGYAWIQFNEGIPTALYILDPDAVQVQSAQDGSIYYEVSDSQNIETLPKRRFLPDEILHIVGLHSHNGITGISPVMQCKNAVAALMAAELYGSSAFGNGSGKTHYLKSPTKLTQAARKETLSEWNADNRGPFNSAITPLLENGLELVPFVQDLEKLQYIETRKKLEISVCQMFGISAVHRVSILDNATFSNITESNLDWWQTTIRFWTDRFQREVMRKLFTISERKKYFVEFDMNELLRDPKSREDCMTPNEKRLVHGLNPVDGGDVLRLGPNLEPIGDSDKSNPNDLPEVPTPAESPPPSNEPDKEATDAIRGVLKERINQAVIREVQALKRAAKRDGFQDYLDSYAIDHREHLATTLDKSLRAYRQVTKSNIDIEAIQDVATRSYQSLKESSDPISTLDEWLSNKAEQILNEVIK